MSSIFFEVVSKRHKAQSTPSKGDKVSLSVVDVSFKTEQGMVLIPSPSNDSKAKPKTVTLLTCGRKHLNTGSVAALRATYGPDRTGPDQDRQDFAVKDGQDEWWLGLSCRMRKATLILQLLRECNWAALCKLKAISDSTSPSHVA